MPAKALTFWSAKGGAGKSALSAHVAAGLALRRVRTLLLDCDPVASATTYFCEEMPAKTLAEVLDRRMRPEDVLVETPVPGLALLPAGPSLFAWDRRAERAQAELARLFAALGELGFAALVVDMAPAAGALVRGVLGSGPLSVYVPCGPKPSDLLPFGDVFALLEEARATNPGVVFRGVVPTRWTRGALADEVLAALKAAHGGRVFPTIHESAYVARVPLRKNVVQLTNPKAAVAEGFRALVAAIVKEEKLGRT